MNRESIKKQVNVTVSVKYSKSFHDNLYQTVILLGLY